MSKSDSRMFITAGSIGDTLLGWSYTLTSCRSTLQRIIIDQSTKLICDRHKNEWRTKKRNRLSCGTPRRTEITRDVLILTVGINVICTATEDRDNNNVRCW